MLLIKYIRLFYPNFKIANSSLLTLVFYLQLDQTLVARIHLLKYQLPTSLSNSSGFREPPDESILKYFEINDFFPSILNCWYNDNTSKFPNEYA